MRYLGLDLGDKTLGTALSDPLGIISSPGETIFYEGNYDELVLKVKEIVKEKNVGAIILGLPKNMNNTEGERANKSREFKALLEQKLKIPIILEDERLTSKSATQALIEADMSRKNRKKVIDSVAASIILKTYLDKK